MIIQSCFLKHKSHSVIILLQRNCIEGGANYRLFILNVLLPSAVSLFTTVKSRAALNTIIRLERNGDLDRCFSLSQSTAVYIIEKFSLGMIYL